VTLFGLQLDLRSRAVGKVLEVSKMAEIKKAKVKKSNITQAVDLLQDLPKKVKEEHSLREAVKAMYPTIQNVLKKGYSYDEVATMLEKAEIMISGTTLRQYVREIVKQKKPNQTAQKDVQSSQQKTSEEVVPQSQSLGNDEATPDRDVVSAVDVVVDRAEIEIDTELGTDVTDLTSDALEGADRNVINPNFATNAKSKKLRQSGQPDRSNIENEFNK
jgi:hypothetical protein